MIKGGSYLCADSYCKRYRRAAKRPQMIDTGMSHIGFRCLLETAALASESVELSSAPPERGIARLALDLEGSRRSEAGCGATAFEFDKSMGDALSADEQKLVDSNDD